MYGLIVRSARAEEEATEVLARRARQASERDSFEDQTPIEPPPAAVTPKATRDRILSAEREAPPSEAAPPPSGDNLRRLLRTLEEDHRTADAPEPPEAFESGDVESSAPQDPAPQLDFGLTEVRVPGPILPDPTETASEPDRSVEVDRFGRGCAGALDANRGFGC